MKNKPLEIEYKFLIEMPDLALLREQPQFREKKLCQLYLELPDNIGEISKRCRIRKTEEDGKVTFRKTFKQDVTSLTRIEIEEEIDEAEFEELSKFIADGTSPIEKTRYTFIYKGYTLEVDVFPFWSDLAFLEIEVESEEVKPPLPPFIKVIKDVSSDKNYRNASLARRIFEGSLI